MTLSVVQTQPWTEGPAEAVEGLLLGLTAELVPPGVTGVEVPLQGSSGVPFSWAGYEQSGCHSALAPKSSFIPLSPVILQRAPEPASHSFCFLLHLFFSSGCFRFRAKRSECAGCDFVSRTNVSRFPPPRFDFWFSSLPTSSIFSSSSLLLHQRSSLSSHPPTAFPSHGPGLLPGIRSGLIPHY